MSAQPVYFYSEAEYLRNERASEQKHEYADGEIYALAGASERHNLITINILASLHGQLRKRPCSVYSSDMRVRIPRSRAYTYPDISVVCGGPHFTDSENDVLLNPLIIFEVLSPSTERYDRGKKFANYRLLEDLQAYILVSQDKQMLEQYTRQADDTWLLTVHVRADTVLQLASIGCQLALNDVYDGITFDPPQIAP